MGLRPSTPPARSDTEADLRSLRRFGPVARITIATVDPGGISVSYEFECTNVVPGCEGKVEGETAEEVFQQAAQHANDVHGLQELDEATVEAVNAAIVTKG